MAHPERIADVLQRLEEVRWKFYSVHPVAAKVLGILARASGAKQVIEVGTGSGYSAIVLGAAVRPHGGRVFTIERDGEIAAEAQANVAAAGLQDIVTVIPGSAFKILRELQGPWDLAFLDGTKQEYTGYLERILPKFSAKALLCADNLLSHADELADFHARVSAHPHLDATIIPVGTGLLVGMYEVPGHGERATGDGAAEERAIPSMRELMAQVAPAVKQR